jgi:hypothetical protein
MPDESNEETKHEQPGTELLGLMAKWVDDDGISLEDAVSHVTGFAVGLLISHKQWSPEQIGDECKCMAEKILDALRAEVQAHEAIEQGGKMP